MEKLSREELKKIKGGKVVSSTCTCANFNTPIPPGCALVPADGQCPQPPVMICC